MADLQLKAKRKDFVKKVNKTVVSQVSDGLLEDGVLNMTEKEHILENYNTAYDRACQLIDIVWKKGAEASMKMIFHIRENDPSLYSDLGLSYSEPAQSGPA